MHRIDVSIAVRMRLRGAAISGEARIITLESVVSGRRPGANQPGPAPPRPRPAPPFKTQTGGELNVIGWVYRPLNLTGRGGAAVAARPTQSSERWRCRSDDKYISVRRMSSTTRGWFLNGVGLMLNSAAYCFSHMQREDPILMVKLNTVNVSVSDV